MVTNLERLKIDISIDEFFLRYVQQGHVVERPPLTDVLSDCNARLNVTSETYFQTEVPGVMCSDSFVNRNAG